MVQKAVNAEANAGLRSSTMVQNLDAYYPKHYLLSHNTSLKIQTQGSNNKNFSYFKELELKNSKPALLYNNATAKPTNKKDRKEIKKRFQR